MDVLSEVLSLLELEDYVAGSFVVGETAGLQVRRHQGLKCYALVSGACWLEVDGLRAPVRIAAGDCVVLPHGRPFCLTRDPALPRIEFMRAMAEGATDPTRPHDDDAQACAVLGGHFLLAGGHSGLLLDTLPPVVHIRRESSKAVMRASLECLREELRDPQPGGSLIARQLAYLMLVQALRLHLQQEAARGVGWLQALADPRLRAALGALHADPARAWTIQELADLAGMSRTVFAQRFRQSVGMTSMDYLARWRMTLAGERLRNSDEPVSRIAWSVGYETESAFGKAFRRVMGHTPRTHRKANPLRVDDPQ